ncbi:hypothetical protein ALC62_10015, partial [Cyphomyrmex costatus]
LRPILLVHIRSVDLKAINIGKIPLSINGSMGGLRSDDNNFLADCTACNCIVGSKLPAFATNSSKLIFESCLSMSSSST